MAGRQALQWADVARVPESSATSRAQRLPYALTRALRERCHVARCGPSHLGCDGPSAISSLTVVGRLVGAAGLGSEEAQTCKAAVGGNAGRR